jgi:hypothetical protein
MLAFGHTLNCKDAHLFKSVVSKAPTISFHGRPRKSYRSSIEHVSAKFLTYE